MDLEGAKSRAFYENLAFAAVPVLSRAGTCLGVLRVGGSEKDFSREDVLHLTACASAIAANSWFF